MNAPQSVLLRKLLVGLGFVAGVVSATAAPPPIRILPLGDSITYGYAVPGGYRLPLYQLLTNAGFNVDFTGTQTDNGAHDLRDPDHEGHPGWAIRGINAIAPDVLASTDDPDVILLLIGVNDYNQNDDIANAHTRLQGLVENLATNRPYAKILVANLLATTLQPQDAEIQTTFNPFVPTMAADEQALGRQVYFDDLRSALTTNDLADGLHPNQIGYNKMATNWFGNLTNYISPLGTTNLPGISHARGVDGWTNVIVTFSKPVADSATNVSNYSLSGGLNILAATLDSNSRRVVTLTTTRQLPQSNYTLTVSGVPDITPGARMIPTNSTAAFTSAPLRGVFNNVPEVTNFTLVYSLDIPNSAVYGNPSYSVSNVNIGAFDRVGYYLELQQSNGPFQFIWVSMNPFTTNVTQIGVPTDNSSATFQQPLTNMNVFSPVPGIVNGTVNGTVLSGGNIEFWPGNYDGINSTAVPNASSTGFDWGDRITGSGFGYGSMQLHNNAAGQVLLAFNHWGANGGVVDLGIGNRPNTADVDWTFANNGSAYSIKTLQVLVRPLSDTSPPLVASATVKDPYNVSLTFNEPVAESATNLIYYSLNGGLSVLSASLDPVTRTVLALGTSAQTPSVNYTLTINGVQDRFGNVIATNTSVSLNRSNSVPIITAQPQPQAAYAGGAVTFSVGVSSALPVTNQWYKEGSPIIGETNASLTLNNVQSGDAANYHVLVGNINGTTSSDSALLTLLMPGSSLEWRAIVNSGVWDTGTSPNWINVSNSQPTVFNTSDQVLFDDTFGVPTTVVVNGTVSPSIVTVNSIANNFTISGPGAISGPGSLVKLGSSALTLTSGANFTGPVTIGGGSVYAGNNSFQSVASVTISNGATLDLDGSTYNNHQRITVSGTGMNGQGAIYNSNNDYPVEVLNFTLTGDTKFGGSSRWDLGSGSQINGAHNLTLDWSGAGYSEWTAPIIGAAVPGITLTNGNLGIKNMDASFQNPDTVLTVRGNCQAVFWSGGWNGSFHVLNGGLVYLWTAPAAFNGSNIILEEGANWQSWSGSTAEPINSAVTLNGIAHFLIGDHNMVYTNLISGAGGFVVDAWNHQLVFSASNTYAGPTIIGDGPQVALTGNGSISHSSLIFFGGNNSASVHVDVSGRPDKTLTLASGQTLAGIGAVNGSLVVASVAILSPAGTNTTIGITTGTNATGTIMATNTVALNGTTVIKLNGPGVNDSIQAGGGITYGGTLNLVNISGSPLAVGNSFQIFTAASYAGSFANIVPAAPAAGLAWDTSQLNHGFLNVVAGPSQPVISTIKLSGSNLIFSGTGGTANGNYSVMTTTNLTTPLANWTALVTNSFDSVGAFSVTNAINSGTPQLFYRIKQAP
jgi:autotransporter-associated beta strand protein